MTRRWLVSLGAVLVVPCLAWLLILLTESAGEDSARGILGALRWATVLVAAISILVLVAVGTVARAACRSRRQMSQILPHVLGGARLAAAGVLLAQGALIAAVLWEFTAVSAEFMAVSGQTFRLVVVVPLVGVVWTAYRILDARSTSDPWPIALKGLTLDSRQEPTLFAEVEDVARRVEADPPDRIVASFDPRFFMVATRMTTLDGEHNCPTLHVSLSSMGLLTHDEFRAVIGHELAHFREDEAAYSERIAPRRGIVPALTRAGSWGSTAASLAVATVLHVAARPILVALGEMERDRELCADRHSAAAAPNLALASAISKLTRTGAVWEATILDFTLEIAQGLSPEPLASSFVRRARQLASGADRLAGAVGHPLDLIPPTSERLRALEIPRGYADAADLRPDRPALGLFHDAEATAAAVQARLTTLRAEHPGLPASAS